MVVLDTNLLIALERGEAKAVRTLQQQAAAEAILRVPAVVWLEFLSCLPPAARQRAEHRLLASAQFVAFDFPHAQVAVHLQHSLLAAGVRLGWSDVQVAAAAVHAGEALLSNDEAFDRVPGLLRIGF